MTRTTRLPRRAAGALLAGALAALALPGVASAATAEARSHEASGRALDITAEPGEQNRLTITFGAEWAMVEDAGAPVAAQGECEQLAANRVRCPMYITDVFADLGDGDDEATVAYERERPRPWTVMVRGGAGDDSLHGGPAGEWLDGGAGGDVLDGGSGDDTLVDGDAGGSSLSSDLLDGGLGTDTVAYHDRTARVEVRLEREGDQGEPGERDTVRDVENARGGSGADLLVGDAARNDLDGGAGRDHLDGRGGDDDLDGQGSADVVRGGPGDDRIQAEDRPARADAIGCGSGRDHLATTDPITIAGADCETVLGIFPPFGAPFPVRPRVDRGARRATYHVPCTRIGNRRRSRCSASITLRTRGGRLVGRGRGAVTTRPHRGIRLSYPRFAVPLRLSRLATRTLQRRGRMIVRATVRWGVDVPGLLDAGRGAGRYTFVLTR